MEEGRNEGGKQRREGWSAGLTGLNLPLPPIFQTNKKR